MKKITSRLHILNGGSEAYQIFLRNLTPQILLLSSVVLLGMKLDFMVFDIGNFVVTLSFFILLVAFVLAAWINLYNLYKSFTRPFDLWQIGIGKRLDRNKVIGWRRRCFLRFYAVLNKKMVELVEFFVINIFLQAAIAVVIVQAIVSAKAILRMGHLG